METQGTEIMNERTNEWMNEWRIILFLLQLGKWPYGDLSLILFTLSSHISFMAAAGDKRTWCHHDIMTTVPDGSSGSLVKFLLGTSISLESLLLISLTLNITCNIWNEDLTATVVSQVILRCCYLLSHCLPCWCFLQDTCPLPLSPLQ